MNTNYEYNCKEVNVNDVSDLYGYENDSYTNNGPCFIFKKSSIIHESDISRAYGGVNIKYHENVEMNTKPLYVGVSYPTVLPLDLYDYDDDELQSTKKQEYLNDINNSITDDCEINVTDRDEFMKWSTYGKFVYVYHT